MSLTAINAEFWGDLQRDLYVENTAMLLANRTGESVISQNGKKIHRPIMSQPTIGTYTPGTDITSPHKTATDSELSVSTFKYASETVDRTHEAQTPYDLVSHSQEAIRRGLLNQVEQEYLSKVSDAGHNLGTSAVALTSSNVIDKFEHAKAIIRSNDAPMDTGSCFSVMGPQTIALLQSTKADRATGLGDTTLANGVTGSFLGWTVVENNNLPYSATLTVDTQPTANDTVTIANVTFKFVSSLSAAGDVLIGADVAASRANLKAAIEGGSGAGTTYTAVSEHHRYMLTKRAIAITSAEAMAITGFGDIMTKETFTAGTNVFSAQKQTAIFMCRGAIDLVLQLFELDTTDVEKQFGRMVKGMIGVGAKAFEDGQRLMVKLEVDASSFR